MTTTTYAAMTSEQIQARLDEIAASEAAHAARDMDAELREAMLAGKDVDALEALQDDAEKATRRARVERQALEAQLPHATRREGEVMLAALAPEYDKLKQEAAKHAECAADAWDAFIAASEKWASTQGPAGALSRKAVDIAKRTGADLPAFGTFTSARLSRIRSDYEREDHRVLARLASGERGVNGMAQQVDGANG